MKKRTAFVITALALCLVLAVSCNENGGLKDTEGMTEYYSTAREAFRLSTRVTFPEIPGVGLKDDPPGTYEAELNILKDVVRQSGSHDFNFDFTEGVSYDVYSRCLVAIAEVFGQEHPNFPRTEDDYVFNCWHDDNLSVMITYKKDNSILSFMVFEGYPNLDS
ncbi:MAG: hypothetical protein IIU49_04235 [Spirochaetales bacterium]|nr:hypothetical protein [Spirochaetales bacterium]